MFKYNVVIDPFEDWEDIDDENEIIMNVNVAYATKFSKTWRTFSNLI